MLNPFFFVFKTPSIGYINSLWTHFVCISFIFICRWYFETRMSLLRNMNVLATNLLLFKFWEVVIGEEKKKNERKRESKSACGFYLFIYLFISSVRDDYLYVLFYRYNIWGRVDRDLWWWGVLTQELFKSTCRQQRGKFWIHRADNFFLSFFLSFRLSFFYFNGLETFNHKLSLQLDFSYLSFYSILLLSSNLFVCCSCQIIIIMIIIIIISNNYNNLVIADVAFTLFKSI